MFGMSSEEFWEYDPQLYWAYRTFYLKKIEQERERDNQYMWLQGMYIYDAFSTALNNAFSTQSKDYAKKPYSLNGEENKIDGIELTKEEQEQRVSDLNNSWSRLL